jgi:hypothetical protein
MLQYADAFFKSPACDKTRCQFLRKPGVLHPVTQPALFGKVEECMTQHDGYLPDAFQFLQLAWAVTAAITNIKRSAWSGHFLNLLFARKQAVPGSRPMLLFCREKLNSGFR